MDNVSNSSDRWVSRRQAAQLLSLNPTRMSRYLSGQSVRTRQVPYGANRQTVQFWLADLQRISDLEIRNS